MIAILRIIAVAIFAIFMFILVVATAYLAHATLAMCLPLGACLGECLKYLE